MNKPSFLTEPSFIAYRILSEINENPKQYNLKTHAGLIAVKNLGLHLADKEVKSLRGTYEQGKLVGFCIATHWNTTHKQALKNKTQETIGELVNLNNALMQNKSEAQLSAQTFHNAPIDQCLVRGFQVGFRLGKEVAKELPVCPFLSTPTLIAGLKHITHQQPVSVKKIISARKKRLTTPHRQQREKH